MDTSKEYIEMIDNPWIQGDETKQPMLMPGDYFIRRFLFEMGKEQGVKNFNLEILYEYRTQAVFTCTADTGRDYIRVLRQDQLQDIWKPDRSETAWAWNSEFTAFLNIFDVYDPIVKSNMSMEQLMLCFVMHERWGKKWGGKNWI